MSYSQSWGIRGGHRILEYGDCPSGLPIILSVAHFIAAEGPMWEQGPKGPHKDVYVRILQTMASGISLVLDLSRTRM